MKVSVIMSVFNSEKYISDCIRSILNQSYKDLEFIIVNDASTDGTYSIIEQFAEKDKRIRVIKNIENKGLTYNLNRAIEISDGDYIARMDSDDISVPERLEKQVSYLDENKNIDICGSWSYLIDSENHLRFCAKRPCNDKEIKGQMLFGNPITHSSVMMRRTAFDVKYDESFRTMQDYKLWVDWSERKFYNIPEYLLLYRINNQGVSKTERKNAEQRIKTVGRIYKEIFNKQGIEFADDEILLIAKSMQNVEKFSSVLEAKEAKELIERIIHLNCACDKSFAYSRWALTCTGNIGIKMPIIYGMGIFYRVMEVVRMIPKREDYRRIETWYQNYDFS